MKKIKLYGERFYPYIISLIICIVLNVSKFNFINSNNMNSLIDGIVTMESIVIGLIGAIIPVILSMKNESKFVKYIFENDTKHLFRKYLTSTIGIGILSVTFSLAIYIRDEYTEIWRKIIYNLWLFLVIAFLLLTYRSMKYMIIIIFSPDTDNDTSNNFALNQNAKDELRKKHSNNL